MTDPRFDIYQSRDTTMLTKNTEILRHEVAAHIAADALVAGHYWHPDSANPMGWRGCFISCLTHADRPEPAEERFGLPVAIMRIAESIFERLPAADAKAFFAALPDAVKRDGKDLSRVHWAFLASELRALPPVHTDVQAVIDPVIEGMDAMAEGREWDRAAARAAADAAYAADYAAADAAAEAAYAAADAAADVAYAAADAAYAAYAATDAAAYAARAAVTLRQRDTLLRLIAEAA